jgi:hypothetical protein
MADNDYDLFKPKPTGYRLRLRPPELQWQPQRLTLLATPLSMWIVPRDVQIVHIGSGDMLRVIGRVLAAEDRQRYLLQTPEPIASPSVGLSLYSDNTPDFFTRNAQFNLGLQGFGFPALGKLYIQGSADHPSETLGGNGTPSRPVTYSSYQFNISTDDLPLMVLDNATIAPNVGIDSKTGRATVNLDIEFKKSFLKSITVNLNNINSDWRRKMGMDSAQIIFEIPFN